jgi:galacturonosyltransferase
MLFDSLLVDNIEGSRILKTVCMVANDSTFIYNLRREIIQRFMDKGYVIHLICQNLMHVDDLKKMGCRIHSIKVERHSVNPFNDLRLYQTYKDILKQIQPDVVFTNNVKPNVYCGKACGILHIPYIVNVCGLGTPLEKSGIMQKLLCAMYKEGVKKAFCVFFQNSENQQFFIDHNILSGRYRLLPGSGVNLQEFKVLPYPNNKSIHFMFIARIMKEKGIDQYMDAAKVISTEYPNTVFHVIGGCDDNSYLDKLEVAQKEGYIKYHGQQSNILSFLRISSCTIHPTYYPEGMSNVLLESAACGRPIITTNRSGCREIINDGINGFICKQKDSEDLVKQIKKFLSLSWEQRRKMGLLGRKKIENKFDRQLVADIYNDEINKISQNG